MSAGIGCCTCSGWSTPAWIPALFELGTIPNLAINVYGVWSILFVQIAFVIAILRHGLFSIDLLINRTLVYGVLTACVAGAYTIIVGGFGALLQSHVNLLVSLLATGIIALLFQPLRERLQRDVNHLMYGERDEPYRVLSRLGQQLEAVIEPAAALAVTVETLAHALGLPFVAIRLKKQTGLQPVAAYGAVQNDIACFPPLPYTAHSTSSNRAINCPKGGRHATTPISLWCERLRDGQS